MITVKTGQLYEAKSTLSKIAGLPLPVTKSYVLSKIVKKLYEEHDMIEQKRMELIKKYGENSPENPQFFKVKDENNKDFFKDFNELLSIEVTIDVMKIKLSDISITSDGAETSISASELLILEPFIDFEETAPVPEPVQ